MWGQGTASSPTMGGVRIIPTRVGTRDEIGTILNSREDHPHACGDKSDDILYTVLILGSSPRVWGQGTLFPSQIWSVRIIPTRVGTRLRPCAYLLLTWDHPHACGDKLIKTL